MALLKYQLFCLQFQVGSAQNTYMSRKPMRATSHAKAQLAPWQNLEIPINVIITTTNQNKTSVVLRIAYALRLLHLLNPSTLSVRNW